MVKVKAKIPYVRMWHADASCGMWLGMCFVRFHRDTLFSAFSFYLLLDHCSQHVIELVVPQRSFVEQQEITIISLLLDHCSQHVIELVVPQRSFVEQQEITIISLLLDHCSQHVIELVVPQRSFVEQQEITIMIATAIF